MGKKSNLWDEATKFLKKRGFAWDGRKKGEGQHLQILFERRIINTPAGGKKPNAGIISPRKVK